MNKMDDSLEEWSIKHQEQQDADIDKELDEKANYQDIQELKSEQYRIIERYNLAKKAGNKEGMNKARIEFRQSKINLRKKGF